MYRSSNKCTIKTYTMDTLMKLVW